MAITYSSVIQQILNELGAVKGATAATADTNFTATPDVTTVIGPDFVPNMIDPALAATLAEIVEAIASTPHHPERQRYFDETNSLANRDPIPETGSGGERIIGVPGYVKDASDGEPLEPASLDAVRSVVRFDSTVYADADLYFYCINGGRIEHTRTNVVMEVCVFTRPLVFVGDIPAEDWHEGALVQGSVMKLALKESMFASLFGGAKQQWDAHLAEIRNYGNPDLYGKATAAPSST